MKENKPILFINSASTNNYYQQEQFVFDSRIKTKEPKLEKRIIVEDEIENREEIFTNDIMKEEKPFIIEEINEENEIEEVEENEEIEEKEEETQEASSENNPEVPATTEEESLIIEKPFANKIRLLTKRAQLNRYVLVAVVVSDGEIEGLFKDSSRNSVTLETNGEEFNIEMDEIDDIKIIRV